MDRVEDLTRVTVYSNLPEVELLAYGISLEKKQAVDHFFTLMFPIKTKPILKQSAEIFMMRVLYTRSV